MRIATAATQGRHDDEAIAGACRELARELGGQPDFVVAYHISSERSRDGDLRKSPPLRANRQYLVSGCHD